MILYQNIYDHVKSSTTDLKESSCTSVDRVLQPILVATKCIPKLCILIVTVHLGVSRDGQAVE